MNDKTFLSLDWCLSASLADIVQAVPGCLYDSRGPISDLDSRIGLPSALSDGDFYLYIRRGGSVLGVAHLDYVESGFHACRASLYDGEYIFSTRLDDRLGLHGLAVLSDMLGDSSFDVLLTTGEESALSSASLFSPADGSEYNWVFELDRRGLDCVTYNHDTKAWRRALGQAGFSIATGTYSDISSLSLPVCKVNFGIGYHDEHTKLSYARIDDFCRAIKRIKRFIGKYAGTKFVLQNLPARPYWYSGRKYNDRFLYGSGYGTRSSAYSYKDSGIGNATGPVMGGALDSDNFCADCGFELLTAHERNFGVCDLCLEEYERGAISIVDEPDDDDDHEGVDEDFCDICGLGFDALDLVYVEGVRYCVDCIETNGVLAWGDDADFPEGL